MNFMHKFKIFNLWHKWVNASSGKTASLTVPYKINGLMTSQCAYITTKVQQMQCLVNKIFGFSGDQQT